MRALIWEAPGSLRFEETETPQPGPNQLLVQTRAVGLRESDLDALEGRTAVPQNGLFSGNDAAGEVHQVGEGVEDYIPGDRVFVSRPGGKGGLTDFFVTPVQNALWLSDAVTWEQAAAVASPARAMAALGRVPGGFGEAVAIFGMGALGLSFLQLCGLRDAARIIVIDRSAARLQTARRLSATDWIDAEAGGVAGEVRRLTGNEGVHLAMETSGIVQAVHDCIGATRSGGRILLCGAYAGLVDGVDFHEQSSREITIHGCADAALESCRSALELVTSGQLDVDALASHRVRFDDLAHVVATRSIDRQSEDYVQAVVLF
ncbi:MAG: zinc-dependent alcohol dehydrogenase [Acidobacteriota bacterium]